MARTLPLSSVDPRCSQTIRLPASVLATLDTEAEERGVRTTSLIEQIILTVVKDKLIDAVLDK